MEQSEITSGLGGALQGGAIGFQAYGPVGAAVGGVVGGVAGFLSGGGEDEAKKAARAQAREIKRAAVENRRVQTREANRAVSLAKTATYAANLLDTGTARRYRNAMESEYRRGIDFDYYAQMRRASVVKQYGNYAADTIQRQGIGTLIGGITAAGTTYAKSGGFSKEQPTNIGTHNPTLADWRDRGVPTFNP